MMPGYLFVDHSNSPGLPEDVARRAGYDPRLCREGKKFEADTLSCAHCKCTVVKSPNRDLTKMPRHKCQKCGGRYICDICAFRASQPDYVHRNFEKRVNLAFDAAVSGKAAGGLVLPD